MLEEWNIISYSQPHLLIQLKYLKVWKKFSAITKIDTRCSKFYHTWQSMNAWNREDMCRTDAWNLLKKSTVVCTPIPHVGKSTFDCSAKPARMTCMWSTMCPFASKGIGWQTKLAELPRRALCISAPTSSHDSRRMWATQSMNSFGLQNYSPPDLQILTSNKNSACLTPVAWKREGDTTTEGTSL